MVKSRGKENKEFVVVVIVAATVVVVAHFESKQTSTHTSKSYKKQTKKQIRNFYDISNTRVYSMVLGSCSMRLVFIR